MKHLIEYKLWAGQIPYFVVDPLGGVFSGSKCYGVSLDKDISHLPDTVKILSANELWEIVKKAELYKQEEENGGPAFMDLVPMTKDDRLTFYNEWLARNGLPAFTGADPEKKAG